MTINQDTRGLVAECFWQRTPMARIGAAHTDGAGGAKLNHGPTRRRAGLRLRISGLIARRRRPVVGTFTLSSRPP